MCTATERLQQASRIFDPFAARIATALEADQFDVRLDRPDLPAHSLSVIFRRIRGTTLRA